MIVLVIALVVIAVLVLGIVMLSSTRHRPTQPGVFLVRPGCATSRPRPRCRSAKAPRPAAVTWSKAAVLARIETGRRARDRRLGGSGRLDSARPRDHRRRSTPVPQPLDRRLHGPQHLRLRGRRASPSSIPAGGGGFGSKIDLGDVDGLKATIEENDNGFFYLAKGRMWVTEYPVSALQKAEAVYTAPELVGMRGRPGRPVPEVPTPRLSCARVPDLAVVRVPVSRFAVQPGRREDGAVLPRGAWTASPCRDQRVPTSSSSTPAPSSRARPSAPTPPARRPKGRRCIGDSLPLEHASSGQRPGPPHPYADPRQLVPNDRSAWSSSSVRSPSWSTCCSTSFSAARRSAPRSSSPPTASPTSTTSNSRPRSST